MALAILAGCTDTAHHASGEIDALYWHEGTRYTARTIDDGGLVYTKRLPPFGAYRGKVMLYTDVEPGKKSWYECNWMFNNFFGASDGLCEIHIHDLNELGTADWNHGKFGTGSTTRID